MDRKRACPYPRPMRTPLGAALAAALVLAAPAAASAADAARGTLGPRAAARAFGQAADRFDAATRQAVPEVQRRIQALTDPVCARAIGEAPREAQAAMGEIVVGLSVDAVIGPLRPAVDGFVGELAAVRTRDRVLRSGRSGWRRLARDLAIAEPAPPDACAQLDAWRAAGYPADAVPALPRISEDEMEALGRGSAAAERKVRAAGRRMRRLGVSRATVRRFTGRAFERVLAGAVRDGAGTRKTLRGAA